MKIIVITPNGDGQPWNNARLEVDASGDLRIFKNGRCIAYYYSDRWDSIVVMKPEESGPNWKMIAQDLAAAIGVGAQTTQGAMQRYREALEKS